MTPVSANETAAKIVLVFGVIAFFMGLDEALSIRADTMTSSSYCTKIPVTQKSYATTVGSAERWRASWSTL